MVNVSIDRIKIELNKTKTYIKAITWKIDYILILFYRLAFHFPLKD